MENNNVVPIPAHIEKQAQPFQPVAPRKTLVPGTIGSMIMGIIAVSLCWFSIIPVAGLFFFIPSLILGIISFKNGTKGLSEINKYPEKYSIVSIGFLKPARITGLISIIAAPALLIIGLIWFAIEGMNSHMF
jgi:hypothetical protein